MLETGYEKLFVMKQNLKKAQMRFSILLFLFLIVYSFESCTQDKDECNSTHFLSQNFLEGNWVPDYSVSNYWMGGEGYYFYFKSDSFYLKRTRWSDAGGGEGCMEAGWCNYIAGAYTLDENTISLKGSFVDSSFTNPVDSGQCYYHEWGSYYLKAEVKICYDQIIAQGVDGNSYYSIPIGIKKE